MLRLLILSLFMLPAPALLADTPTGAFDDSEKLSAPHPEWFKESFLDLQEDLREVEDAGKKGLMLYFGTQGCAYCRQFMDRSLGAPDIAARVQKHFDAIGLEIFDDAEMVAPNGHPMRVKVFAKLAGAEFSPTVVFLDPSGRLLLRLVGYHPPERFKLALDYLAGGFHDKKPFRAYAAEAAERKRIMEPRQGLTRDPLFISPPYALGRTATAADRPLLVLFEQQACGACSRFHQSVLTDPLIRRLLQRFEVVQLDAGDRHTPVITPRGERTNPAAWAQRLDLTQSPALLFFDENGEQVLKVDSLVLHQRMVNSLNFVLERAYEQGMTYQRFARAKALEKFASN